MSIALRTYRNAVVDSPPELLDSFEVTAELNFDGSSNSSIDCGAIHDAVDKLWISFWFKLDTAFSSASAATQELFAKYVDGTNYVYCYLDNNDGKLYLAHGEGAGPETISSAETSFAADIWHHIIVSMSTAAGQRMIVNGGTAVTEAGNQTAISLVASIVFGTAVVDSVGYFVGEMRDVAIGIDDLSGAEEAALLKGIVPVDATQFYPLNEGTGTVALDYGSGGNNGTIDSANSWLGTGAQSSIIMSPIPAHYGELILIWEDLIVNNAAIQNLQLTMVGGAGDYDYSNLAFGTASTTQNAANFILLGTCGDVPGVGRKSNGYLRIFNRAAVEKVCIGTEVGTPAAQTTLHDLLGFHIEAKDRTVTAGVEITSLTITPAAGSLMGGGKVYLLGIKMEGGSG